MASSESDNCAQTGPDRRGILFGGASLLALLGISGSGHPAFAQQPQQNPAPSSGSKPNILVIMADDVGMWNLSTYHRGMMGGRTPNIDRIANEGALFTDYLVTSYLTSLRARRRSGRHTSMASDCDPRRLGAPGCLCVVQ
jgi:arylsulfatase A-like enzyme